MLDRVLQHRRICLRLSGTGVAVLLCSLALAPASASAAEISGLVFNDFNTNGIFDNNQTQRDLPLEGFTVKAFTGTNTEVAHDVSGANGHYSMHVPNTRVRLELFSPGSSSGVAPPWWPTRIFLSPGGVRSDVQFIDGSSTHTDVDFAVHRPDQWSFEDPLLFWPTQWAGPPVSTNANFNQVAIRRAPYSSKRPAGQVLSWANLADRVDRATFGQIGTVFGLAIDNRTDDLYAGAYQKRLAGLKHSVNGTPLSSPPGAIFKITPQGHVSVFTDLPAGTDPHPASTDIEDWVNCGANANANPPPSGTDLARCDFSWTEVGKIGLGGVVIDPQNNNLYTVNLENDSLYRIPLSTPGQAVAAAIPNPGCDGGIWRPILGGV